MMQPVEEITEQTARERFDHEHVSVTRLQDESSVPDYTVVTAPAGRHVRVYLYNVDGSTTEQFDWAEVDGETRLFLTGYGTWVYPEGRVGPQGFSESLGNKGWVFRQDGTADCREAIKGLPEVKITRYSDLDMSGHWRERPVWGDWNRFGEHPEPDIPSGPAEPA